MSLEILLDSPVGRPSLAPKLPINPYWTAINYSIIAFCCLRAKTEGFVLEKYASFCFLFTLSCEPVAPTQRGNQNGAINLQLCEKGFLGCLSNVPPGKKKRKETKQNSPYCLDRRSLSLFEMQTGSSKTLHGPTASSPRLWEVHTVGKEVKGLYNLRLRGKEPPTTSGGVSFCPRTVVWSRGKGVVNGLVRDALIA